MVNIYSSSLKTLEDPSLEKAKFALRVAKAILELSSTIDNPLDRDGTDKKNVARAL